jgi:KR domain
MISFGKNPYLFSSSRQERNDGANRCKHSRQQYLCIDYDLLLDNEGVVASSLSSIPPKVIKGIYPMIITFDIGQLEQAHEEACPGLGADTTALLDLSVIDDNLDVYRCGIIDGTPTFNPCATCAILGGVGVFGVALARCMADRGARHIVLTSRSGEGVCFYLYPYPLNIAYMMHVQPTGSQTWPIDLGKEDNQSTPFATRRDHRHCCA